MLQHKAENSLSSIAIHVDKKSCVPQSLAPQLYVSYSNSLCECVNYHMYIHSGTCIMNTSGPILSVLIMY